MTEDRIEYRSNKGIAAFWTKDGLWHIALPDSERGNGMYWTEHEFNTKAEAIAAINNQ